MMRMLKPLAAAAVCAAIVTTSGSRPAAQLRLTPVVGQQGTVGLGLAIRKLESIGTLMMTTAHPDDENNGMLAHVGLGLGWRAVLLTATRGDGGQNEIGPELFDALAVLRTEELGAVHRFDGAEQYFTRAVDFGYSFSVDETLQKWGKDEILGDFVRMIRTIRPDVIVGFVWEGRGGGQHHQTSSRLTAEAFRAAADPTKYPEQIKAGLRPWQAKKFYYTQSFGFGPQQNVPPGVKSLGVTSNWYDSLLGRTYAEVSGEARSMHKCQGMGQVLPLAGTPEIRRYFLQDCVLEGGIDRKEQDVTDGIQTTIGSLAAYAGATPPAALTDALAAIQKDVATADEQLWAKGTAATIDALSSGLNRVRELRKTLPTLGIDEQGAYEIDFRLAQKEEQFGNALVIAHGLRIDVTADDGLIVPGQMVTVTTRLAQQGLTKGSLIGVELEGFEKTKPCGGQPLTEGKPFECKLTVQVPADAKLTTPYFKRLANAARYEFEPDAPFGLPFRPTPFRAKLTLGLGQVVNLNLPVQYRYEGNIFSGEKRMELNVVPPMALRVSPEVAIVPLGPAVKRAPRPADGREIRVSVTNHTKGAATGDARLDVPAGWTVTPASVPVSFTREDEEVTVRFRVVPDTTKEGRYDVKAVVKAGGVDNTLGYQVIEYPHTQRRHVVEPAVTELKVLDVKISPGLKVGYVMGVGDLVPPAIEQLGASLTMLTADDLAFGDLSKFDVIVTGVRAYERRADLRANNHRLLDYAQRGGTVLVQYNKFEFNEAQYGPYPAKVSSNRVTDEGAPINVLVPEHKAFTTPNRLGSPTWDGWVQERGLYFLGEKDPQYTDLLETSETFEYNAGAKRGALVEARTGKGRWLYVGLNLWRQLPAGTPGAYRLMANLLSLGKLPPVPVVK